MYSNRDMSHIVTIQLEKPVASASLEDKDSPEAAATCAAAKDGELSESEKAELKQACTALQDAVNKVNEFQDNIFRGHQEQIARLSVEIARKILVQKVQERDYAIETIVKESLANAPTRQNVVVHLNPEDVVAYQKAQQDKDGSSLTGIEVVADANIGRAECMLDTPKGTIESLIDEH